VLELSGVAALTGLAGCKGIFRGDVFRNTGTDTMRKTRTPDFREAVEWAASPRYASFVGAAEVADAVRNTEMDPQERPALTFHYRDVKNATIDRIELMRERYRENPNEAVVSIPWAGQLLFRDYMNGEVGKNLIVSKCDWGPRAPFHSSKPLQNPVITAEELFKINGSLILRGEVNYEEVHEFTERDNFEHLTDKGGFEIYHEPGGKLTYAVSKDTVIIPYAQPEFGADSLRSPTDNEAPLVPTVERRIDLLSGNEPRAIDKYPHHMSMMQSAGVAELTQGIIGQLPLKNWLPESDPYEPHRIISNATSSVGGQQRGFVGSLSLDDNGQLSSNVSVAYFRAKGVADETTAVHRLTDSATSSEYSAFEKTINLKCTYPVK
jgi:hypothetical protein